MQRGDIPGSVEDCEAANSAHSGDPSVLAQLAGLYLASGKEDKSATISEDLLNQTATRGVRLTDDEWGHVVILGYLALTHSRPRAYCNLWLQQHVGSYAEERSLPVIISQSVTAFARSISGRSNRESPITVQSPWFERVAQFFLQDEVDASSLLTYSARNSTFDPKQQQCLEFFAHFYSGMRFTLDKSSDRAKEELELALKYDQRRFVEYWIAQSEHNRIQ
jgi:hypothetical protein